MIFVGIDWSETSHDVAVLGEDGRRLQALRIQHGVEGAAKLQEVLAELTADPSEVVVAVEAAHGLLVNLLVGSGYAVYPINPRVAARYRERDSVAGVKSDRRDAVVLANLVRTDRHQHRPLAGDSEAAQAIRARARAHLRAVRTMIRLRNQLRSLLLEFYPAAAALLPTRWATRWRCSASRPIPSAAGGGPCASCTRHSDARVASAAWRRARSRFRPCCVRRSWTWGVRC
jgi:transposase